MCIILFNNILHYNLKVHQGFFSVKNFFAGLGLIPLSLLDEPGMSNRYFDHLDLKLLDVKNSIRPKYTHYAFGLW
jgi:hypothetical protein